jgi:hypothetical protein
MHWILNETVARLHLIITILSQVANHPLTYLFFQVSGNFRSLVPVRRYSCQVLAFISMIAVRSCMSEIKYVI